MGKGSTQAQHLVQTEVPPSLLEAWLGEWSAHHGGAHALQVRLRPHRSGTGLLEVGVSGADGTPAARVVFATIHDRNEEPILLVRDQEVYEPTLRRKRLMTLVHVFLLHRYGPTAVHYVSPTEENHLQTEGMKRMGLYTAASTEVGHIIVADVDSDRVEDLANQPESRAALIAGA